MEIGRILVTLGVALVVAGLFWPWLSKLGIGRLPGDIFIERESLRIYIPIATSLLISVVLSVILWFLGR